MYIIGLTGSVACGKSTVTNILQNEKVTVIDADKIAHRHLESHGSCWQNVVKRFGDELDMQNRIIDRKKLGNIIFNDEKARKDLDDIMHPYIKNDIQELINLEQRLGTKAVVLDIPLLIETGWYKQCDEVWLVTVDNDTQLKRLMARNNLLEEEAQAMINSQMPLEEKKAYADFIIDNSGSIENTEKIVKTAWHRLLAAL